MYRLRLKETAILMLFFVIFTVLVFDLQASPGFRPAGPTVPEDGKIRLVVFNPIVFNLRALATLRKLGLINIPDLEVIGVYHAKQTGNFEESRRFVKDTALDWVNFYEIKSDIRESDLFKTNALTPEFEKIIREADGVIFFGGPDIPPSTFRKKTNLLTEISDPYRHYLELSAVFHLLGGSQNDSLVPLLDKRPDFPVLGICLGFQTINVGTGGTLIQDIWSELYKKNYVEDVIALGPEQWHNNPYVNLYPLENLMRYNFHTISLKPDSVFCREMGFSPGDYPRILSSHHQAVGKLGHRLKVYAASRDGRIIEAFGHQKYPNVLGVQFHPEHPLLWDEKVQLSLRPGDPPTSYYAILAGTPPSVDFNQKIWKWFAVKLQESHKKR